MPDFARFFFFMCGAFFLFFGLLRLTVRRREHKPSLGQTAQVALVVVVGGMLFARYAHLAFPHLSWIVYYGTPALTTVALPPLWLRMSRTEAGQYLPLAWLSAPCIHLCFSLFVGWHDYMPFPVYIPSVAQLLSH